jgi:hypothetical protein
MLKRTSIVVLTAGLLLISGCGGAGDTSRLDSIYKGGWSGNWVSSDWNDRGTIAITVTGDGSFGGSIAGTAKTGSGTFSGQIDKYGKLIGVASFPTGNNWIVGGQMTLNNARITSNFSFTINGVQYGGAFDAGTTSGGTTGGSTAGGN